MPPALEISTKLTNSKKTEKKYTKKEIQDEINSLKNLMDISVKSLDFETAIKLRDRIGELKNLLHD